jgi:hypothetical protein
VEGLEEVIGEGAGVTGEELAAGAAPPAALALRRVRRGVELAMAGEGILGKRRGEGPEGTGESPPSGFGAGGNRGLIGH